MRRKRGPVGVILAGGLGRRIGGSKATVKLCGKPLIAYPLEALTLALDDVAVLAKRDTELPGLPGITVWIEPDSPRHPLVGLICALEFARGRAALVCAGDLPFVTPELVDLIARANRGGSPAIVASHHGAMQPLLGCYQPVAGNLLRAAATAPDRPLREVVAAIKPRLLEVDDPDTLFNVDAPDDLLQAAAMLDERRRVARGQPNVKS